MSQQVRTMTHRSLKLRLQAAAATVLARLAPPTGASLSATVDDGCSQLLVAISPVGEAMRAAAPTNPLMTYLLAPFELLIVQSLLAEPGLTSKKIASRVSAAANDGYPNTRLKVAIALLIERGILAQDDEAHYTVASEFLALAPIQGPLGASRS